MWAYSFTNEAESVRSGLATAAGIIVSLGVIAAPFWRPARRYLTRRRIESDARRNATLATTIAAVMRPEIDGIRAAARQQHNEQNTKLDAIGEQLADIAAAHGEHLARHDVEIAVLQSRNPNARTRATDKENNR